MITVKTNGIVEPFGLHIVRDSEFGLLAPLREYTEELPGVDGEFYFGSDFGPGEHKLKMLNVGGFLTAVEKDTLQTAVAAQLYALKEYDLLVLEWVPDKVWRVRLTGKPDMPDIPGRVQLTITLKYQPFRISVAENYLTGIEGAIQYKSVEMAEVLDPATDNHAILINKGTIATPLKIEIVGAVTNPSVVVGAYTLTYTGTLTSSDTLIIDTGAMTCTFNGVNAMGGLSGMTDFIALLPGGTAVTVASAGATTFKWYDTWA